MQGLYDNTKKSKLTNTTRKEKYPKRMFFENYEYIPKQPLIKFLEDKIKELEEKIKNLDYNEIEYYDAVRIDVYQEVLDFVNKGDK